MATSNDIIVFSREELDLIVELAGCSLDEHPGSSNWVQAAGGLPEYICQIAKAIKKTGKTTSAAISIAVSRVKKWAAGADGVDKSTQAKAAAAVAEWEKLKAKAHAKTAAKDTVKASHGGDFICLASSSYNVDAVRSAWNQQNQNSTSSDSYSYVKEMWSDYLIVRTESATGNDSGLIKVGYTVAKGVVTFDTPVPVQTQYVEIVAASMVGADLSDTDLLTMLTTVGPCHSPALNTVLLSIGRSRTALDQVMAMAKKPTAVETILTYADGS